jgi:hypothetical protein
MRTLWVGAAVAAGVLAICPAAWAGSSGVPPLRAYVNVQPALHLFGDTVHARLTVLADRRRIDPASVRVAATFAPYELVERPQLREVRGGRFDQLTWSWTLRCLSAKCLPGGSPKKESRVFRFPDAQVGTLRPDGKFDVRLTAAWPGVEVLSRLNPGVARDLRARGVYDWRYSIAPVAPPTFRIRPLLLSALALAVAASLVAAALAVAVLWYLGIRPRAATAPRAEGTSLARALSFLTWAHKHGDETLQRKAFERVGDELGVVHTENGLSETAHELAWRPEPPEDAEVQTFARQARKAESESTG